jgi:hypothetical protein
MREWFQTRARHLAALSNRVWVGKDLGATAAGIAAQTLVGAALIRHTMVTLPCSGETGADTQRPSHHRPLHLLLLECDVHTVGRQVESQAPGLRVQLDDDAIFIVLEVGEGAALNDRHAGCERRVVATEIRGTG